MTRPEKRSDHLTMAEIRDLVGRDDPIFLDIGANKGQTTGKFLATFKGCRAFAFEPDSRAIKKWLARYAHDPRATLIEAAVGIVDGTVDFHVSGGLEHRMPEGWDMSGSIRAPKRATRLHKGLTFPEIVTVPSLRLDTWLANTPEIERIDFIWADVQGAEGDLISGASASLAKTRFFYTEYSNRKEYEGQLTLDKIVASLPDFEIVALFRSDVLFKRRTS